MGTICHSDPQNDRFSGNFHFSLRSHLKNPILTGKLAGFVLFLFAWVLVAEGQTYSGEAAGIKSTVIVAGLPGPTTAVTDTGPLPAACGTVNLSSASANVPNILTAGASTVSTSGTGTTSQSTASVAGLNIAPAGIASSLFVTADAVSSTTNCTCPTATCTGSSTITNLQIGGVAVTADGSDNQTVV